MGIDVIKTYIDVGNYITRKFKMASCEFRLNSVLNESYKDANLIYVAGTCFSDSLFMNLSQKLNSELPEGAYLISISRPFNEPNIKLESSRKIIMPWGKTDVFIQKKC